MTNSPIIDRFGRKIANVRISVTDRCNFRCRYCMPTDPEFSPKEEIITFEEIIRLTRILHSTGIHKYRLTGGEPTIRKSIDSLVRAIKEICPKITVGMTTNGVKLAQLAPALKKAGLDSVNISLDSTNEETFNHLVQRKHFNEVMQGIEAAIAQGFKTKINAVALKGITDREIDQFLNFSEQKDIEVRFIELMPFNGNEDFRSFFLSKNDLLELFARIDEPIPLPKKDPSQTSTVYGFRNRKARIGFIPSVTESFCASCNRIRITASGTLRPCLHAPDEIPLRELLRNNDNDEVILATIREGVSRKWKEHPDFNVLTYKPPVSDRAMMLIGG
ncbi:MAG: GTP 3',8-cyclase MoaA [Methanobacteriota archaeon]|nr:MAG: GTP 3',8-cyclase MoaA [Euryarchaeota archaeon]